MNNFEFDLIHSILPAYQVEELPVSEIKKKISRYEIYIKPIVGPIFKSLGYLSGYEYQLMEAIPGNCASEIKKFCDLGADFNTTLFHLHGYTPLIFAIDCKAINSMNELIQCGADVNKRSNSRDKVTALYMASRLSIFRDKEFQISALCGLLENGANPNLAIKGGTTPIMEVSSKGNVEAINLFMKYKIDFNLISNKKNTALDLAINRLGIEDLTVQKMIALGAKCFDDVEKQLQIVLPVELNPKINKQDIFNSGYLLPDQAIQAITQYNGNEYKIKKYDERFPSLFRSVLRGEFEYILYDSHSFTTTCKGCLNGKDSHNYLGKGGEAKIKIAQVVATGDYVAVRISKKTGIYELEILSKMGLLIDYVSLENKHYIIQRLLKGTTLLKYLCFSFEKKNPQEQYFVIKKMMIQLLKQLDCLHKNGYIHRDLASDNIMVDPETDKATIIDFGAAVKEPSYLNGYVWNSIKKKGVRVAPELKEPSTLFGYPYSEQTDIYALGLIFTQLLQNSKSLEARLFGKSICQQMLTISPHERQNAAYYLNIFTNMAQSIGD